MTIRTRAGRDLLGWRGNHATWTERRWVEAIEAIELEAMRQHELLGPTIVVWLIERGQSEGYASPIYYADRETPVKSLQHDPAWTRDAYRAMRFPTKEAALTFMESQRDDDRSMPGRPVEHGFIEAASPDTGVAEGAGLDAERCAKCGSTDLFRDYHATKSCEKGCRTCHPCERGGAEAAVNGRAEHFYRGCRNCHYKWMEPARLATPASEEAPE